ncbi:MAG: pyridoxamine 5'-phosphate oxidase family protein [Patescibacteria group bacterium]|nr:MAG: pyridoxamine 5'-phosphate oxidase family protein [Patescibacteria group bacterium]
MEPKNMETDIKQLIQEVLEKGYLMSLAIVDTGGVWVADVVYIHDDELNIYWMSDPDSRHSLAILGNNRVAATITANSQGEDNLGIQFDGVAEKLDGDRHDLAIKHFAKRKKPEPSSDEDILQGDSWYMLKPKNIDLIYEKLYGFKKQKFEL